MNRNLYVGYPHKSPNFSTLTSALASLPKEETAPASYPAAPDNHIPPVTIYIAPGTYEEQVVISRPHISLIGEDAESTILSYHLGAFEDMPDGSKRGTFRTASVRVDTHDFTARNITFRNNAGFGHTVGQALAMYAEGDRLIFENCIFLGSQDTLFTAPLPPTAAKPGGFTGPGEFKPRILGRQYYKNCFLRGDVDFIFGSAICYFDHCTIFSQMPGDRKPPESPEEEVIYGYITAASTPKDEPFGYVFESCNLISDCPKASVYLGRPWREFAKTVFLRCEIGEHIHPLGWQDWKKPHECFYYGEYACTGPGADTTGRAGFSHVLSDSQAAEYTLDAVLGGIDGWKP